MILFNTYFYFGFHTIIVFFILYMYFFFFFKQKTAYEGRISDWSSDVCSSDLVLPGVKPSRRDPGNPVIHCQGPMRVVFILRANSLIVQQPCQHVAIAHPHDAECGSVAFLAKASPANRRNVSL